MKSRIVAEQATITVAEPTNAQMSVVATGDGLTYAWKAVSANAPVSGYGTYFRNYYTGNTTNFIGEHQYQCTVTDKYGDSVDVYVTVKVVKKNDLYVYPASYAVGINGSQLTTEEIMAKSGTSNSLSAVSRMTHSIGKVFDVFAGSSFPMNITSTPIPKEYTVVRYGGYTHSIYDEVDSDGVIIRERTPVQGEITYCLATSGNIHYMEALSSDFTTLSTGTDYTWEVPETPGAYHFMMEVTNTYTFSNGTEKASKSFCYFTVNVWADNGPSISGSVSAHGAENDSMTVQLTKSGESTPVASKTLVGNDTVYSFVGLESGTYTLKITKGCNETYTKTVKVGDGPVNHDVTMVANHKLSAATCQKAATCTVCGSTVGEIGEHKLTGTTCTEGG